MELGYINYMNCYPFYYHMFEKQPLDGIRVVPDIPSGLNSMLADGTLTMSPISAAAYADMEDDVVLLPDFCLSSIGYVRSVVLKSRYPIEDLEGKRLGLSSASRTSVVLLKVLLKNYYGINPIYLPTSPNPTLEDVDAALVIGNDAMLPSKEPVPYIYDLGDLWLRKSGFPVVFAVFALRESRIDRYHHEIKQVVSSYYRSLECLKTDRKTLIQKAQNRYPEITYDVDTYYSLLKFNFTEELKNALAFYLFIAGEMDLLPKVKNLKYISVDV